MTTTTKKWMLLSLGAPSGLILALTSVLSASAGLPLVVTNLTGFLRIQHGVPCGDDVDQRTPVTDGRLELTPSEGRETAGGGRSFTLTRASFSFAGFSIRRSCRGFDATRTYGDIQVQLARSVSFTGAPVGRGVFVVRIPKEEFLVLYSTIANREFETANQQPKEDVTAILDFRTGRVQMRVVLGSRVRFQAGCTRSGCMIDETHDGTLTATIAGTMVFPDTDRDGVPDRSDNCRLVANPDQTPVPTPVITAPADQTQASCVASFLGTATASDVCDAGVVTVTNNAPATFALGANVVRWTAEDAKGRRATDRQTVTIVDTTAPTFTYVPPDVVTDRCRHPDLGRAAADDDCARRTKVTNDAPARFPVGTTVVTWTATDASGNRATATQRVTVTAACRR